jgi:hypothetical protein
MPMVHRTITFQILMVLPIFCWSRTIAYFDPCLFMWSYKHISSLFMWSYKHVSSRFRLSTLSSRILFLRVWTKMMTSNDQMKTPLWRYAVCTVVHLVWSQDLKITHWMKLGLSINQFISRNVQGYCAWYEYVQLFYKLILSYISPRNCEFLI